MKKYALLVMFGALMGVSACTAISEIEGPENGILTEEVVITAIQEANPQTKTVLQSDGSVWWKPNDAIGVFFGTHISKFHAYNMEDSPSANFIGNALIIQGHNENSNGNTSTPSYWGVFPPELSNPYTSDKDFKYSKGNSDYETPTREGESVNVYLPARQKGVAGTFDSNNFISIAKSDDYKELSFYNLCGGLAFCVEREGIHTVTFKGNAGETLAGGVNVVMNSEGRPVVNEVRNGKTEVTLTMNTGEYFVPGEWYYMVMLPTTLSEGYTMNFYTDFEKGTVVSNDPVNIKRSVFGRLTEPELRADWITTVFIRIDGEFSDWDNLAEWEVSVANCAPSANWTALKTLKTCVDSRYLHVYFEFDQEQISQMNNIWIDVFVNADNSRLTGGYNDMLWKNAYIDYLFETMIIDENGQFCSYDPLLAGWEGELGGSGWEWNVIFDSFYGLYKGSGSGNKYELSFDLNELAEYEIYFNDGFKLGIHLLENWQTIGVLPNADVTDRNPSGLSSMLTVKRYSVGDEDSDDEEEEKIYTIDDVYTMFKAPIDFEPFYRRETYIRDYFFMSELRGDNVTQSLRTTDPTYEFNIYGDTPYSDAMSGFWYASYEIIHGCNQNIELMNEGEAVETDHMIGECYFLRALAHFNLVNLFATPYNRGQDKPGVIIRTSTDRSRAVRATVGQVYEQIVSDLEIAARLMKNGVRRGDASYVSYDSARALLARVYLYMGKYHYCVAVAEEMLGSNPSSRLVDIESYFSNTRTSDETLWCVSMTSDDLINFNMGERGLIGSMYDFGGWCELFWSDPLMELMLRHPEDKRLAYLEIQHKTNDGKKMVHWPCIERGQNYRYDNIVLNVDFDMDAETNLIDYNGGSYTVRRTVERTGYPEYYIENLYSNDNDGFLGANQTKVYVRDNIKDFLYDCVKNGYPIYAMSKFSNQDGHSTLASPAFLRWGEVVLNLAEAYAHLGNEQEALRYVNVIRSRAGIPTWSGTDAYKAEGYDNVLDVVLDERRLELCFEGHRAFDLYRNSRSIDRRFAGVHVWEALDLEALDDLFPYCIPEYVISTTGIVGNGKN